MRELKQDLQSVINSEGTPRELVNTRKVMMPKVVRYIRKHYPAKSEKDSILKFFKDNYRHFGDVSLSKDTIGRWVVNFVTSTEPQEE